MAATPEAAESEPDTLPAGVSGSAHPAPMFARPCGNTSNHQPHNYYKRWYKSLLAPYLREPDTYPDVWDSPYRCPGVDRG